MPPFKDEHILLIAPGSQTTLAQLGLPESFTPARYRFPTRMFPAEKKGEFEPYKVREKRREVKPTNGADKEDVEMKEAPPEGAENAEQTQPAEQPAEQPSEQSADQQVEQQTEQSAEQPVEQSTGQTAEQPAEQPAEQQGEGQDSTDVNGAEEQKQQELQEEIVYEEDLMSDEGAVYPIQNGQIVDWPCFLALLTHIYNTLSPPFHTPILLIAEPVWSARDRETLTQFIFEKFKTPAFCLMDSALAACYAYGTSTATVIDVGHGKADVTAVTDFIVQEHGRGIALEGCGGEAMTDRLEELLKPKGFTREMCEQLKRSNITEILPPGTPLPGSGDQTGNPAAAASTGITDDQTKPSLPRGPGHNTQVGTEGGGDPDEEEGVLNVAAIVTGGNTSEYLARREREKAEKAASKKGGGGDQANKPVRLPNSKKEKATFQFEEFVRIDDTSGQYIRQKREIEVGVERFLLTTPTKERVERCSDGILEDLAAQIHHTIMSVPDASKRSELWDSLIILGNGSRIKGFSQALVATLTQKYMLSPSATMFTSEIPSNLTTPMATGGTNTPANPGQTPGPMHHPAAHGVNPLLVAATHANAPAPATPGNNDPATAAQHRSHSQTPTSIRTLKPPEYFPEWKDQGGSNAPGATGAGGTATASTGPASSTGRGMEEAIFLGAQVAAKVIFVLDQGLSKGFLSRVEYNESGPAAIHEFSLA